MRRSVALALGLALLGAACARGGGDGGSEAQEEAPAAPVKVGLLYTVTGQGGEFAQAALGSAELARQTAEEDGLSVEIVAEDYGGQARRAARLADRLAGRGVAGIVVASDDPNLAGALRDFDRVPVLYALLSDDRALPPRSSHFRVTPSNLLQARKLAQYLVEERNLARIAILHDSTPFGVEGAGNIDAALRDMGAEVVLRHQFRIGKDVSTPVTHAGQLGAQALVVWTRDVGEAGRITIQTQKAAQGYQLVLSGNLATFSYGKNASSQVVPVAFRDGIISVGTWAGPWFDVPEMRGFYEEFRAANNAPAPFQAVQVHDGVLVLAEAARDAGASDAGAVIDALEEIDAFRGAGVPLSFSPDSHEGVGMEDMAILAFTKDQDSGGGDLAPDIATGGGFFTIDTATATLPEDLAYVLEGLPR